jgi:hypothetical protein
MADPRFRSTEEPREDYPRQGERSGYGDRYGYSSARDYESAGVIGDRGRSRDEYRDRSSGTYRSEGSSDWDRDYSAGGQSRRRGYDYDYDRSRDYRGTSSYDRSRDYDRNRGDGRGRDQERGFFERAGDEVRSWFGDEEAERRRQQDMRQSDRDYHEWRSRQVANLDRDYEEYRRENAQKFDNEFGAWRTERQTQRSALERVQEHMEVVGSDGAHIGTVDKVRGDRIILTKSDSDAGGHHHSIPSRWIESVDDQKVTIRKTAEQAKAHWRDEERSGAFFGEKEEQQPRSSYYYRSWTAI